MHLRIEHQCGAEEARRRLEGLAQQHGIELQSDGPGSGRLAHKTPMGAVKARYVIGEDAVEVEIEKKPAFLPAQLVKRSVEDGLREILDPDRP